MQQDVGLDIFFKLLSYGINKRRPDIDIEIPTVADLKREVDQIYASESPEAAPISEPIAVAATPVSEKATGTATGCVPCSIGHLGTCSGLLNEAMRFARNDGVESDEVITRVNMCLDELNALERVDLRPEMIHGLPEWEKGLAERALSLSRAIRHDLEQLPTVSGLEGIAGKTQTERQAIGKEWFKGKIVRMPPEQQKLALEKAKELAANRAAQEVEKRWDSPETKS
jgi:hypothetical protein